MKQLQNSFTTERLQLSPLDIGDAAFILELVNTEGWLQFIGDRNVRSEEDAKAYIRKIQSNQDVRYWVVRPKGQAAPIGIITFIKRAELPHPDLGFAFLPASAGMGYAYEASLTILQHILTHKHYNIAQLNAITVPDNASSIKLLKKLGFTFVEERNSNDEVTHVYTICVSD